MSDEGGLTARGFTVAVAGLVAALFLIGFDYAVSAFSCSLDTSYCAKSRKKNGIYTGTLLTTDREPAANVQFTVSFESRAGEDPVAFRTGDDGSFCIRWAEESVTPSIEQSGLILQGSEVAQDRRLTDFQTVEEGGGGPLPGCQEGDAGIPWNRADDLRSSWQFALMVGLAAAAGLIFLLALLRSGMRTSIGVLRVGLALLGAAVVATAAGWIG